MLEPLEKLKLNLTGEFFTDELVKAIYATDASVYRKLPLAVSYPANIQDIQKIIQFCIQHKLSIIPRAAGTSLAGQCVGEGIVVDISKNFTKILDFNKEAKTVTVEPGIIRDDLNRFLEPYGLFFGPNTSTSNRCTIGGMVGNNSSGTTSIKYGVTRDKVLGLECILSDASQVHFSAEKNQDKNSIGKKIEQEIRGLLGNSNLQTAIQENFPKPEIHRRNTGYALDQLLNRTEFNIAKLLCGSEGTLAFTTAITLQLDNLPPENSAMVAAHFSSISDCLNAVKIAMSQDLFSCEMMDKTILDCTKENLKYKENRFFIEDDPEAILMLEIRADVQADLSIQLEELLAKLKQTKAYATPILYGENINFAVELRKAGLGLLANLKGDKKAVACIEDTAVALDDLSNYIAEFTQLMKNYNQKAVYYAHAGAGELHLRPILNLKKSGDVQLFKQITADVAKLVKKYQGAFSGEHGDGRVRGAFLKDLVGDEVYTAFKEVKTIFDPNNIFNPGKIVDALPMETDLRYEPDRKEPEIPTVMNFSDSNGILRAVERCNGSGDCRKSVEAGGAMCPSYRATKIEKDTTRARANALREFLTTSEKKNPYNHSELKEVLDLCISCKACKNECPSNVDMATYKAEFEYQYAKENGTSLRTQLFAHNQQLNEFNSLFPEIYNFLISNNFFSGLLKSWLEIAPKRSLPELSTSTLRKKIKSKKINLKPEKARKSVYLFIDEFTNYSETEIGEDAIQLLVKLGYEVKIVKHPESGRSYISKGFLKQAKKYANENVELFYPLISEETPLIGIEPSAILSFKDEYLRLANSPEKAQQLAKNTYLIEEFIAREIGNGNISSADFKAEKTKIKIHAHCHQKALSNTTFTFDMLNVVKNFQVTIIPSGCCGMAGSFGYEKEHYEISMKIGNQTLFPAIKKSESNTIIAANGTSCRHQIKDGTNREAIHPVSILLSAVK
ncbi:FAD-binding and (Fe-S)-binding domain-containing protein [Mesonia maritima]|uniref:FAD/FMN-containing dehydrogenase/Fe-S oxidoreductase n=1 Tax=Mesonia maritima TaxID=1793873 RepID=A0ABU1K7M4_9FLAO|nr:FAD-linked oxidase C-terminal domain-containing protein [Mesonia maritima]MDR6301627.1 FAD/FMN-containing dehydrogenase/Fe-S oxidoreductase [Mesonia maritima]